MAVVVTKENFESEVLKSELPVLVDFWAAWCGPCRMVAPAVEELAEELKGTIKVAKLNVDEQPELAAQFGIMSIPTLMVFKNGKIANKQVGVVPKATLKALVTA